MHSNAPFTIQRICELCIRPQEHYKAIGKYLRAIEKTLLVTSTWDSFPNPVSSEAKVNGDGPTTTPLSIGPLSAPTTPIFSPIPFLHSDARSRSKSRSPTRTSPNEPDDAEPAFGRVDELDDPRPGHLSDSPTPISSTTTITTTLQDRFVKGEDQDEKETHGEAEAPNADKTEAETKLENTEEKTEAGKEEKATGSEGGKSCGMRRLETSSLLIFLRCSSSIRRQLHCRMYIFVLPKRARAPRPNVCPVHLLSPTVVDHQSIDEDQRPV
jgi:hypothetical protein